VSGRRSGAYGPVHRAERDGHRRDQDEGHRVEHVAGEHDDEPDLGGRLEAIGSIARQEGRDLLRVEAVSDVGRERLDDSVRCEPVRSAGVGTSVDGRVSRSRQRRGRGIWRQRCIRVDRLDRLLSVFRHGGRLEMCPGRAKSVTRNLEHCCQAWRDPQAHLGPVMTEIRHTDRCRTLATTAGDSPCAWAAAAKGRRATSLDELAASGAAASESFEQSFRQSSLTSGQVGPPQRSGA